jgi:hypothetical protein
LEGIRLLGVPLAPSPGYCVEYTNTPPFGKVVAQVEQPPGAVADE